MTENLHSEIGGDTAATSDTYQLLNFDAVSSDITAGVTPESASDVLTPWAASDYARTAPGSGGVKLSLSAVAPLVAAARGYEGVRESQAKDFAKRWMIGDARSKKGQQFLRSFREDDGDILVMPWNSVDNICRVPAELERKSPTSLQIRPKYPRTNEAGKVVKYEFLVGDDTILDFHPAVTRDWIASAGRTMIAEGLLKGDACLSAQLRAATDASGNRLITDDELRLTDEDLDRSKALKRLNGLLQRIPQEKRVAIISIAGVGNWRSNTEWTSINVKDDDVYIAFDGDVATNWNVWNMAKQLFDFIEHKKKGKPALIDFGQNVRFISALADPANAKIGLDDFFHHLGTWDDVIGNGEAARNDNMISATFPERPARTAEDTEGLWRVTGDGTAVEARLMKDDRLSWVRQVGIGGRIKNFETIRAATAEEQAGEPFGKGVVETHYPMNVCVELCWIDGHTGVEEHAEITGPSTILNYSPAEWARHGAVIPRSVLSHHEWPPRKGLDWLSAIKGHEREQLVHLTTWSTMGYVPVVGDEAQAFIVGPHVIAQNAQAETSTRPGVTEATLSSADKFGVHDVYRWDDARGFHDPSGTYDLREDIQSVMEHYIWKSPWLTREIAATILGSALRPAVPLPTNSTCYFVGAPQKGKSWTAEQIMSFWQWKAGGWDALPGSASDTFASTENAISKTPIWVADDLAPSTDRNQANAQENSIGALIRSVHNGINKRRMNADMTAKAAPPPMAFFILTAENEHSIASVRQRVVTVEFTGLNNEPKLAADDLAGNETTASRVTAAIIRNFIRKGADPEITWKRLVHGLRAQRDRAIDCARDVLTGGDDALPASSATRPAGIAADVSLGLYGLELLCRDLGLDNIADELSWDDGMLSAAIGEQVKRGNQGHEQESPGAVLLSCIRDLLAAGNAHIGNLDSPGLPPISDDEDAARINSTLGWRLEGDDFRPCGPTIGWYTWVTAKDGENDGEKVEVIVLQRDEAFTRAQQKHPRRILHGASHTTSWKNAWDTGLIHPSYQSKRPKTGVTCKFRLKGGSNRGRVEGIPVSMDILFGGTPTDTDE